VAHVMDLPLHDLPLYTHHAERLMKLTGRARA
jgi:hypothetical protein